MDPFDFFAFNPRWSKTPDDAVEYTSEDVPELGIRKGMTLKAVLWILIQDAKNRALNGINAVTIDATDIVTAAPPAFLLGEYSNCWTKVSGKKGQYSVAPDSGTNMAFSYDFQEAISTMDAMVRVTNMEVQVFVTKSGVQKLYSNTGKPSNAYIIDKADFPLSLNIKVYLESSECSAVTLEKSLSIGTTTSKNSQFLLEIKGQDGFKIGQSIRFTQEDLNNLMKAKIAKVLNIVDDFIANNYAGEVQALRAKTEELKKLLEEETLYDIGTGTSRQRMTQEEVFAYIVSQLRLIQDKIEVIEEERRRASLLS